MVQGLGYPNPHMQPKEIGKRIVIAREAAKPAPISQSQLARILVGRNATKQQFRAMVGKLSGWETCRNNPKEPSDLVPIAEALDVSFDWLLEGKGRMEGFALTVIKGTVHGFDSTATVISYAGVLAGLASGEYMYELTTPESVPTFFLTGGAPQAHLHVLLKVPDSSMSPRIVSGDKVLIFLDPTPRRNTIVFAESSDGKRYLKALKELSVGLWSLVSLHPEGPASTDLLGWKLHGYAIAVLKEHEGEGPNIEFAGGSPLKVR